MGISSYSNMESLTLEQYQGMNPSDRKRIKRGDLQLLLDEFLGGEDTIASLLLYYVTDH